MQNCDYFKYPNKIFSKVYCTTIHNCTLFLQTIITALCGRMLFMLQNIQYLNFSIFILFFLFYGYQFLYIFVRLFKKMPVRTANKFHKYGVLIAARNESLVIGELLESLRSQNYPKMLLDIYVIADNCTDETARVARQYGAVVFERINKDKIGKGYALNYAFEKIKNLCGFNNYDGYLVFDADNVLNENFVREINAVFDAGYRIVTSYRNSKNFGYNWISAGYALWFLRESKYLNGARMICNTSCAISGTGFLVSSEIIEKDDGWKYNLLTEDIEFTIDKVINGEVIGYAEKAILFDEQPVSFKISWKQRMRWAKGFYQVMCKYGIKLLKGLYSNKGFQYFDMFATIAPATLLSFAVLLINVSAIIFGLLFSVEILISESFINIFRSIAIVNLSFLFNGLITLISEWRQIRCANYKKIVYLFTFPIFMLTYVPIAIVALLKNVTWEPIPHTFLCETTETHKPNYEKARLSANNWIKNI